MMQSILMLERAILYSNTRYRGIVHFKEEHFVSVGQPHREYLTHLALQSGNAAVINEATLGFTGKCKINEELEVIGCDSININTGCMGRVIHRIEEKIGLRKYGSFVYCIQMSYLCVICSQYWIKKFVKKIVFELRMGLLVLVHSLS